MSYLWVSIAESQALLFLEDAICAEETVVKKRLNKKIDNCKLFVT